MNQEVTDYISQQQPWQIEICEQLRKIAFDVIPDVTERMQYAKPHYLKNGKYACVITVAKAKVTFTIFNALQLDEIKGFFESTTAAERKTATIKQGTTPDYALVKTLLEKASATL